MCTYCNLNPLIISITTLNIVCDNSCLIKCKLKNIIVELIFHNI